jgi:hypothetical protein
MMGILLETKPYLRKLQFTLDPHYADFTGISQTICRYIKGGVARLDAFKLDFFNSLPEYLDIDFIRGQLKHEFPIIRINSNSLEDSMEIKKHFAAPITHPFLRLD